MINVSSTISDYFVNNLLKVKLAGGATAQCLGLMNAIFLKQKYEKEFQIDYFPFSTGTYWPFEIEFLLDSNEIGDKARPTRGLNPNLDMEVGRKIIHHPLNSKKPSYERLLSYIRSLNLEKVLLKARGEYLISGKFSELNEIPGWARAISGGFVPLISKEVNEEMDRRFKKAQVISPFSIQNHKNIRPDLVVHFRLGDKKYDFSYHKDFGSDGVISPSSLTNTVLRIKDPKIINSYIVSDEPYLANRLLTEAGFNLTAKSIKQNIWEDLHLISQAKYFVGSWSQVSLLGAICVLNNGGKVFLPDNKRIDKTFFKHKNLEFFEYSVIDSVIA